MATEVRQRSTIDLPFAIRSVTAWQAGVAPTSAEDDTRRDGVRWIDVDVLAPDPGDGATVTGLLELVAAHCRDELDEAMVADLLNVADRREGERYTEGRIRSLSAFRATSRRLTDTRDGHEVGAGGELVLQPVEFLAGETWVVTCWHPRRTYRGAREATVDKPEEAREGLLADVAERWSIDGGETAGDLATMILHELALSYRRACFAIRGWLEEWELRLYLENKTDRDGLEALWGQMAQLREWIQPLNRPAIAQHPGKAWFCGVTDHRLVARVDDQCIDRALSEIRDLADSLRAAFQILSVRLLEEQRDRREQLQRRIEIAAAAFLVPTLVVGFYGANTKVPGEGTWGGFWGMVVALVVLSALSVTSVWLWQQHNRDDRT